ncbi:MAG: hypothetical protein JWM27_2164, partial [Gemmatimonadetes bacterium]|nr:hypothetical protein [Gemmatimonadota bacterium]
MPQQSSIRRVFAAVLVGGIGVRAFLPSPAPAADAYVVQQGAETAKRPPPPVAASAAAPKFARGRELLEAYLGHSLAGSTKAAGDAPAGAARACGAKGERCRLDVLVATLPDPYDSHLDWAYDGDFEALRRAYERAGYVIDRFWFPARDDSATVAGLGRVPERDVHPGVVLFRDVGPLNQGLRLLYVVGEMPTGGVHVRALEAALEERRALLASAELEVGAGARDTLRILGPAFSGSAASLARTLMAHLPTGSHAVVVSGTATTDQIQATLNVPGRVTFEATVNPTSTLDAVFASVVLRRLRIRPTQIAVLRETSTLYGRGAARETDGTLVVPVPMNVSGMRAQYEARDGGKDVVPVAEQLPLQRRASRVPLPLEDAVRPRADPVVASRLTAPAVEIAIDEIVHALREHRVRLVGLQFTDIRDKLFLAREIRERMHEVQFFTYESNALLLRPEMAGYLRGMLVVSSYPLLLENQWWAPKTATSMSERQVFAGEGPEGVYNAALLQLGADSSMVEYGLAAGAGSTLRPPVWITAVGTGSFVPIAVTQPTDSTTLAYVHGAPRVPRPRPAGDPHRALMALGGCVTLGMGMGGLALALVGGAMRRAGAAALEQDVRAAWGRVSHPA